MAGTQFVPKKCLCDRKKGFWEYESRYVILCTLGIGRAKANEPIMVEVCRSSGGSQFSKFTQSIIQSAFGRRITSMLWLGSIEIDKIMMKFNILLRPHFFIASMESVAERHP